VLDPLLAGILCITVLLGLGLLRQGAASPATWFFFSWFLFTLTALVGLLNPSYRWLSGSYVLYGSLSAPLALGGTLVLLERSVPGWLLPGFLLVGLARVAALHSGYPTAATAGALLTAPMSGVAAYFAFRDSTCHTSSHSLRILGTAFALFTLIAVGSIVALATMGPAAPSLLLRSWLIAGAIMLGIQLYVVSERRTNLLRSSRDALDQLVQERTAELAHSNAALRSEAEERRQVLLALERSEERYRLVSELSSDFSFSLRIDPEQGIQCEWVTEAFERITGYPAEALASQQWAELFHLDERQSLQTLSFSSANAAETRSCRIVRPSNEVRHLEVKLQEHRDPQTGGSRVVGAARDVTESQLSEEARAALQRQVEAAQRIESLGMLAGGIAHDFNNLLAVILGNTRLLQEEQPKGSLSIRKLARIRAAADQGARLTEQMLSYSGEAIVALVPIDLSGLFHDLGDLLQASVGRECDLQLTLGGDGVIEGDPTRLSQVILNLVSNAYEALGGAHGNIRLTSGRDYFGEESLAETTGAQDAQPGEYLWFEVADDGCGMNEETCNRIFEPFFTTKFSGRGLGLASAMGIIQAHAGRVALSSEPGVGTRVRVLIPPSIQKPTVQLVPKKVETTPAHVLVVDDDEAVLELAEEFLHRAGYLCVAASSGEEAIRRFRDADPEIDVVILDLTMPDLDGHQVFHALRGMRADLPVVLSTGYNREVLEETFPGESRLSFLRKPYEPEQLLEAIAATSPPQKT
jgi:PAS domain S-box-containing protein